MTQPSVTAVMLTADRHELAVKAIEYFRAQTYENKRLLIYDTGKTWLRETMEIPAGVDDFPMHGVPKAPIGSLRNWANRLGEGEIIVTWDDDDYSAPTRIAEQVAFLRESGAQAVGYSEMPFWDVRVNESWIFDTRHPALVLGTSLCYPRAVWERYNFRPTLTGRGEDTDFLQRVRCQSHPLIACGKPQMIARIHDGNSVNPGYSPEEMDRNSRLPIPQWKRAPELRHTCEEIFGR